MNFFQIVIFHYLSAYVVASHEEKSKRENNDGEYISNVTKNMVLDESIFEAIKKAVDQNISKMLTEEKDNFSEIGLAVLKETQKNLQQLIKLSDNDDSKLSNPTLSHKLPLTINPTVFEFIEELVKQNLLFALSQYESARTKVDIENFLRTLVSDKKFPQDSAETTSTQVLDEVVKDKKNSMVDDTDNQFHFNNKQKEQIENPTNPSLEESISLIVIPKTGTICVLRELLPKGAKAADFGIMKIIYLPSGATLLNFNTLRKKMVFKKIVDNSEKFYVETNMGVYCSLQIARIKDLPIDLTIKEVKQSVLKQFKELPRKISFVTSSYTKDIVLEVSDSLLEEMRKTLYIRIRGSTYSIDTSRQVNRCLKCHLLGHTSDKCRVPRRSPPSADEKCLDCEAYNRKVTRGELKGFVSRDSDHPTGYDNCKTKQYFITGTQRRGREQVTDGMPLHRSHQN